MTRFGVLAFGVLGLASLCVPIDDGDRSMLALAWDSNKVETVLLLVGFGVPTLIALIGVLRPPLRPWQAVTALAGFATVAVKFHIWWLVPHFADAVLAVKLFVIAQCGGIVITVIAAVTEPAGSQRDP